MIGSGRPVATSFVRDQYTRPIPKYNSNYNLYELLLENLEPNYSPYALGELLYDNRLPFSLMLLSQHTLADVSKRRRTSWVQHLDYALKNNSRPNSPTIQAYKLCIILSSFIVEFLLISLQVTTILPSNITKPIPFMLILLITLKSTLRRFIYLIKEEIYRGNKESQLLHKPLAQSIEATSELSHSNKMLLKQHFVSQLYLIKSSIKRLLLVGLLL